MQARRRRRAGAWGGRLADAQLAVVDVAVLAREFGAIVGLPPVVGTICAGTRPAAWAVSRAGVGHVMVTTALAAQAPAAVLRAVVAHEVGHLSLGHARRRTVVGAGLAVVGVVAVALAVLDPRRRPLCPSILAGLVLALLAVTRRHEREADRESLRLVPVAEAAAATQWVAMAAGADDGWLREVLSTHPGPSARLRGLAGSPVLTP